MIQDAIGLTLRYDFGSISIDLTQFKGYFVEALKVKGQVCYINMTGFRTRQFLRTHRDACPDFKAKLEGIEENLRTLMPDFNLIDKLPVNSESEIVFAINVTGLRGDSNVRT